MKTALRRASKAERAKKISITVDERVWREVKALAEQSGGSLSSHINDALARDLRQQKLAKFIASYEAEYGTITDAELSTARKKWRG